MITNKKCGASGKSFEYKHIISMLFDSINDGDINKASDFYETNAKLILEPGKLAVGRKAIKTMLERFISRKPVIKVESEEIIVDTDTVVCCTVWSFKSLGTFGRFDGQKGVSMEVLRKQPDGSWRIAIDSPWGGSI